MKSSIMGGFALCLAFAIGVNAQTPVITSQPQSSTNNLASAAAFTVVATNAATYQWQFNGANITNSPNATDIPYITGATNATLSLDDLTTNQAGSYTVVVTSPGGIPVTSAPPAQLTIVPGTQLQMTFSGFADGSPSNVTVQLFDHDKPGTVENFLHYVSPSTLLGGTGGVQPVATNVIYTNLIWSRCVPNFVLQAGDWYAADRTNTAPIKLQPTTGLKSVSSLFSYVNYWPSFPQYINNESGIGPLIHNRFGTMAMAKISGYQDSANNVFFFNLNDNSATLDNENGGYTVFGRITSGGDVLQFFNTLGKPDDGIFDSTMASTNSSFTDLPVNDRGWNTPANSNLFFVDFTNLSTYIADTNLPIVAINYPTNYETVTNAVIVFQGTASDDVAVARVYCELDSNSFTSTLDSLNAFGTNWTAYIGSLSPGIYGYRVQAQDAAGNVSTNGTYYDGTNYSTYSGQMYGYFSVPRFPFTNIIIGNGTVSTNLNGTNNTIGAKYTITAKPAKGWTFLKWVWGATAYLEPAWTFTNYNGTEVTTCFISNNMPSDGISITYPASGAQLTNATLSISGKVKKNLNVTNITCQVFSASASNSVTTNIVASNSAGVWSTLPLTFSPGDYIAQVVAYDDLGRTRVFTRKFTILAKITIIKYGAGSVNVRNNSYMRLGSYHIIDATPASGSKFLTMDAGYGGFPLKEGGFYMEDGLTFTVTFVTNSLPGKLTFAHPASGATVTSANVTLGGKISSSVVSPQVYCQIFKSYLPLTGFTPATVTGTNWTFTTNLAMGTYNAVAMLTDANGNTTLASDAFTVNYYPAIAGAYNGLFFDPTNVTETNAGYVSFNLGSSGVVAGSLKFPFKTYTLNVQAGSTGSATDYQPSGFSKISAYLTMNFDFTSFSGQMTGDVYIGNSAYPLTAYRAATKLSSNTVPSPGKYVLSMESEGTNQEPSGDSFAAVTVSAVGKMAAGGSLADNTAFSFSTGVFTNGVWPLYSALYKSNGILIGWETNLPDGTCDGTLYWIKEPANGAYYTNGLDVELGSTGANFVPPTSGSHYQIVLGGGTITTPVTNTFAFKASGASYNIVPDNSDTNGLTGTLLSTGVFSKGSISNPYNNNNKLPFNGVFSNPTNGGGGFTLDAGTNTGYFIITPVPK